MNSMPTLTTLFGWCSAINIGLLMLTIFSLLVMRGTITKIHSKLFGMREEDLAHAYFQYLAQFKIAVIVFNLVPYIALRIMA